jgi:hypothetical protein
VSFACQVAWLFAWASPDRAVAGEEPSQEAVWLRSVKVLPLLAVLFLPLLEPLGYWDSWLAWGLYSVRAPQAEVFIASQDVPQLPEGMRDYCEPAGLIWSRVALDRWSLDAVQAPLYPHPRFQLGVASAVQQAMLADDAPLMIRIARPPDRWSGQQVVDTFYGSDELRVLLDGFSINAQPRRLASAPLNR